MLGQYILDGKTPVLEPDMQRWAEWYERADRVVAVTGNHGLRVSTVFLGLDHSFFSDASQPVLFETMVFGGTHDEACERYCTWDEAETGHKRWSVLAFGLAHELEI